MDLARLRAAPAAVVSRIARTQAPAEPTHSIEDVVAEARRHRPSINIGLIERANQVAAQAHEGQQRASGEPYITHPVEVAYYLATLEMDAETLAAALLHDVPEDTDMTIQDIEKRFGREVGRLVDGVTKLSKFGSARSMEEQQAENIRKMFMAMAEDVRVVIIKLADRLHNMRTLGFLPPEKQARIARQSMEIYAPLAHRLGMWQIKWELEDLSFKYIEPERYRQLVEMLADRRKVRESFINKSIGILRKELGKVSIAAEISGRPKHLYSIAKKMERKGVEFDEIYDVNAIRLLVDDVKDCYAALGVVHSIWRPIPGPVRRLHRHAQGEHVPEPAHRRHRARCEAARGPDPDQPHARRGGGGHRRPLALQGRLTRRPPLRREARLGPPADRLAARGGRCHRVRGRV